MLYAYNASAPEHDRARSFVEAAFSSDDIIGLPWVVIVAFIRIGTSTRVFEHPYTFAQATEIVGGWLALDNVKAVVPGPNHWPIYEALLHEGRAAGNLASDAHIAAMAIENGAMLYTTDRDFARFERLRRQNPLDA